MNTHALLPFPHVESSPEPSLVERGEVRRGGGGVVVRACSEREVAALRATFAGIETDTDTTTFVAWIDGEAVGHVQLAWTGSVHEHVRNCLHDVPELRRLRVLPHARGKGAAKALLAFAEYAAIERGFASVGLAVGVTNTNAVSLYRSCGYTLSDVADFESQAGMDENGNRYAHTVHYLVKDVAAAAAVGVA